MRIRLIRISHWRHFDNIEIKINDNVGLVCLVGANGTGKSHFLELIAACAHRLGLSRGIDIPRGDPFLDEHSFLLEFFLAEGISEVIEQNLSQLSGFAEWNRVIRIESKKIGNSSVTKINAGGFTENERATQFANQAIRILHESKEVYFLSLDANRSYPKKSINVNQIAEAFQIDWETEEYTKGRSYRMTTTLYEEWIQYFLAKETQCGERLIQAYRSAEMSFGGRFSDPFQMFAIWLREVLPHMRFIGVDSKDRTLIFDTTGIRLSFNQLSGGEREIAFLIGQIDRFGLRRGIFLLDEPELHLNSDLIRSWVKFLAGTVETGQIWLATHSLEAVEAAGPDATFVFERNDNTRQVDKVSPLSERPVLSALSRAIGAPAFSISKLLFVFIEGKESIGERDRFRKLVGASENFRFIECGSSSEVVRRVSEVNELAAESSVEIKIRGVIDRDFKTEIEATKLHDEYGIYVLDVHEIENFFLHKDTLDVLIQQSGSADIDSKKLIQKISDQRAGNWIFLYVFSTRNSTRLPEISKEVKMCAKSFNRDDFNFKFDAAVQSILDKSRYSDADKLKLKEIYRIGVRAYESKRVEDDFWRYCEGKQVLAKLAISIGYKDASALERAALVVWKRNQDKIPIELGRLRKFLAHEINSGTT